MNKELERKVRNAVDRDFCPDSYGGIEIFVGDNGCLSDRTVKEIMGSDDPEQYFWETLNDWAFDYAEQYGFGRLVSSAENALSEDDRELMAENELRDFLEENYAFYYPGEHFNRDVYVNILLDTGNAGSDFTEDNVLNWFGTYMGASGGEFPERSSVLWLARQQGKGRLLKEMVRQAYKGEIFCSLEEAFRYLKQAASEKLGNGSTVAGLLGLEPGTKRWADGRLRALEQRFHNDASGAQPFIDEWAFFLGMPRIHVDAGSRDGFCLSCIQELENLSFHMGTMVFLVRMKLFDLFKLSRNVKRREKGSIILGKDTMCGLYDSWNGGGSVLEIELDKDVEIPFENIFDVRADGCGNVKWDIGNVYGMCRSAWKDTLIGINRNGSKS